MRCHRCDKSYVAQEMDRDPTAGHQAICAACATGTAFFRRPPRGPRGRRERRGASARPGTVTVDLNCDMGESFGR